MEHGPVDVMILAAGEPKFDGTVLAELERLAKAGTIRVLDAMLLIKADEDTVVGMDIEDLDDDEKAKLGFIETGTRGMFDAEDSATLAEGMVPGSAVLALAIEHAWAAALAKDLRDAGVEIAMSFRVPAEDVEKAYAAVAAK